MVDENGKSAEGDDVIGAGRRFRDRETVMRLTERSRELIPDTK